MLEFVERAAEELYREAGLDPGEACGAGEVAAGVLGPDCIRFVPGTALPGRAELASLNGRWRIFVRNRLSAEALHHAIGHELGHLWIRRNATGYFHDNEEELADRIGAAVCAPRAAYLRALRAIGWEPRRLGRIFVLNPSSAALRIAETTGAPAALVSPKRIRIRGSAWPWPEEDLLRCVAQGAQPAPGLATVSMERSRVLVRVVA